MKNSNEKGEEKCQNVQLWTMAQQSVCNPKIDGHTKIGGH